jgi:hypothetical protein
MPNLTRRRVNDSPESWHIFYAGVRVGTISERRGNPAGTDPWQWTCGFYPGGQPGADRYGTAPTFDAARDAFAQAWPDYLAKHTEADLQENRDWQQQDDVRRRTAPL